MKPMHIPRESELGTKFHHSHEKMLTGISFGVNQIWGRLLDAIVGNFQIDQVARQDIPLIPQCHSLMYLLV